MTADTWFGWANQLAAPGWVCLTVGLLASGFAGGRPAVARLARGSLWIGGRFLPVLLSLGYAATIWHSFGAAQGSFNSLREVERLFETREMVLAGWLHFLAFDLWVGRWQVDRMQAALRGSISSGQAWAWRLSVAPCLLGTFLFGPIGLLAFVALVALWKPVRRLEERK
jgi:hypothetical protein